MSSELPGMGAVFWPVGTGDSTTIVVTDDFVMQVDLHDMAKADDDSNPEVPVVDRLIEALPKAGGRPYLAVFALTHADKDHCLGVADGGQTAADLGAWICFEDEACQGLRPPKGTTWGRRGRTPVVRVTSRGTHRVSLAALVAVKPGEHPRLIYRAHAYRGRKDERKREEARGRDSTKVTTSACWTPLTSN